MNTPDRRQNQDLRKSIEEYRSVAADVVAKALGAKDDATKERYLTLAKSLRELADTLQGRPSKPD